MGEIIHTSVLPTEGVHAVPPVQELMLMPGVAMPHTAQAMELLNREIQHGSALGSTGVASVVRKYMRLSACAYGIVEPVGDMVVSAAILLPNYNGGHLVSAIATAEAYRRRGYAGAILDELSTVAAELGSEYLFLSARPNVIEFYKDRGFERAHGYGASGYLMRKLLLPEDSAE